MPNYDHALRESTDPYYNHQWGRWANYNSDGTISTYQGSGANCHFTTVTITSTGGGSSHNNLQPYYCVYIFQTYSVIMQFF